MPTNTKTILSTTIGHDGRFSGGLLRTEMAFHAAQVEQSLPLGGFASRAFQAVDSLHTARRGRFNGVARLESITRVVSFEKEKVLRLARQVDPMPNK